MSVLTTTIGALLAQASPDTTVPPGGPSNDPVEIVKELSNADPNFVAVWPLVGIFVTIFGIVLALMFFGGVFSSMKGGLKYAWSSGNEKSAAAGRKSLAHGGAIIAFVIFFTIIAGIAITLISAF